MTHMFPGHPISFPATESIFDFILIDETVCISELEEALFHEGVYQGHRSGAGGFFVLRGGSGFPGYRVGSGGLRGGGGLLLGGLITTS